MERNSLPGYTILFRDVNMTQVRPMPGFLFRMKEIFFFEMNKALAGCELGWRPSCYHMEQACLRKKAEGKDGMTPSPEGLEATGSDLA